MKHNTKLGFGSWFRLIGNAFWQDSSGGPRRSLLYLPQCICCCWEPRAGADCTPPPSQLSPPTSCDTWTGEYFPGLWRGWASLVVQMVKNLPAVQESQVQPLGREDPLEREIATHSSVLAWRIPRTEEPSGLQSMGLKELDTTEWLHFRLQT